VGGGEHGLAPDSACSLQPLAWSLLQPGAVNPMNIQQMMKQAQQMQERLQKQMAEMRVEASAGGGMVTVVINGTKQIQSIKIDPEVVSGEDVEMLQDLIVAALNDAYRKADDEMQKSMGGMLGGMRIPGM
jgi:nucleoid-associated protein EbfC